MGKQLFDLAHLLPRIRDISVVAESYRAAHEQQVSYHPPEKRPTIQACLDDALYTLKVLAALPGTAGPNAEWAGDLAQLSSAAVKLRGYVGGRAGFDRVGARRAASQVALALVVVRKVLLGEVAPQEAHTRWEEHLARIREQTRSQPDVVAASARLRQVPWEQRPHIKLGEFVQTVGPEALLFWAAAYDELLAT